MEKSRDIVNDGIIKNYSTRLQDFGISIAINEDPVEIGRKILEQREVSAGIDIGDNDSQ